VVQVLRLCSVFEPPPMALDGRVARFDPIGGMQNHTAELTRSLDALSVSQLVLTTRPPGAPPEHVVGDAARVVRVGLPVAAFRQVWWLPAAQRLRGLARGVDLVHAHLSEDLAVVPLALAAARGRVPLVVTVHTSLRHTLRATGPRSVVLKSVGALLEQVGERRAAAVLTLTPRLAQLLGDRGVDSDRIHVVPSGVRPALFAGDHRDPFPHLGRPRVVFVGRLAPQKGVDMLVRAAAQLRTPEAQVVVVGDGPNRAGIENEIERLGLRRRVHVTGFVPHDQVPAVLAHADVFVMPSVYEEMGSALVEAQWAGVPIVATRVGGIPDVVEDGVTGVLIAPRDPAALARAVDDLLSDPRRARTMARRGQAASARYDWTRLGAQVLDVYETVTGQRTDTTRPYRPPTRPTPHDTAPPAPAPPPAAAR
jgi:glycosyltransferase involved in cell wall biosynthesis